MIAKRFKLPVGEFMKVSKKKTLVFEGFSVKISGNSLPYCRYGVVISAKTEPKAVRRNRIKRKIFLEVSAWKAQGKDVLFIITSPRFLENSEKTAKSILEAKTIIEK
jgi:ribonuclease P protein component